MHLFFNQIHCRSSLRFIIVTIIISLHYLFSLDKLYFEWWGERFEKNYWTLFDFINPKYVIWFFDSTFSIHRESSLIIWQPYRHLDTSLRLLFFTFHSRPFPLFSEFSCDWYGTTWFGCVAFSCLFQLSYLKISTYFRWMTCKQPGNRKRMFDFRNKMR